jgi:transcription initiation factor TFIIE subunit beta
MALSEQLNKFKLQQERCQTTPSSIAAYRSSVSKPKVTPGFQPINAPFAPVKALQPIKFSDDPDRLQRINSVRKSHPGLQIKLVIELLYKVNAKDPT